MTTSTAVAAPALRRPTLDRATANRLAVDEYHRFAEAVAGLQPGDWSAPTCCTGWDVHALVSHVLGMAEFAASLLEQMRQLRAARRRDAGELPLDALTAVQVEKHASTEPAELVRRMAQVGPRAARGRRRTPGMVRRRAVPDDQHVGDVTERWAFAYLLDVVLTRDTWMHRSDLALATGRPMELTRDHDGVLVDDVVQEWLSRHGQPVRLVLNGPAGGTWGDRGPVLELDAVDFCRRVGGRGVADGLLAVQVAW